VFKDNVSSLHNSILYKTLILQDYTDNTYNDISFFNIFSSFFRLTEYKSTMIVTTTSQHVSESFGVEREEETQNIINFIVSIVFILFQYSNIYITKNKLSVCVCVEWRHVCVDWRHVCQLTRLKTGTQMTTGTPGHREYKWRPGHSKRKRPGHKECSISNHHQQSTGTQMRTGTKMMTGTQEI